jgi:hypothetical protein
MLSALPRTTGSSITTYLSAASNLHNSAYYSFLSMTLSMYLVSEVHQLHKPKFPGFDHSLSCLEINAFFISLYVQLPRLSPI